MARARRGAYLISLASLLLLGIQLTADLSAAYAADAGSRTPSFESAAESPRSTCLPNGGRAESLAMSARFANAGPADARVRPAETRALAKRLSAPIVLRPLHRPPDSLLRQRLRHSSRDDVPG